MIKEKISQDLIAAQKSKDAVRVSVLRMLRSEIHNKEIAKKNELTDEDIIGVLGSEAKKRREAVEQFRQGHRQDLVENETKELEIIASYLLEQLSDQELEKLIAEAMTEVRAESPNDFGKIMKVLMPKVRGRVQGQEVTEKVKQILSQQNGK